MTSFRSKLTLAPALLIAAFALFTGACGKVTSQGGTDSSTHWLQRCDTDAQCDGMRCLCGICTLPCADVAVCPDGELTTCKTNASASCAQTQPVCMAECNADGDCSELREGLRCVNRQCEPGPDSVPPPSPGGGGSGNSGGAGGAGSGGNSGTGSGGTSNGCVPGLLPECEFACPEGTINPVDSNGCTHTCECVFPGTPAGSLGLYYTCGDPVCMGYSGPGETPLCSTEAPGGPCNIEGARCDPQNDCNVFIVCASSDPQLQVGGCPISRRDYKTDIHYLDADGLARYQRELLEMQLATWRYKHDPAKTRLGIIIDDNESSVAVDATRNMVDLYGYTSMAIATLQLQARQLETLQAEVNALKQQCSPPLASGAPATPELSPPRPALLTPASK